MNSPTIFEVCFVGTVTPYRRTAYTASQAVLAAFGTRLAEGLCTQIEKVMMKTPTGAWVQVRGTINIVF